MRFGWIIPGKTLSRIARLTVNSGCDCECRAWLFPTRKVVEEARRLGLTVTGTLGVLDRAAERGLIDLTSAVAALRQTNFRIDPSLIDQLLASDRLRRK